MEEVFLTFRKLNQEDVANDLIEQLKQNNLPYQIEDSKNIFEASFSFNPLNRDIQIKLRPADFPKANAILSNYYASQLKNLPADYYLFQFSDGELEDIIRKPDEWGELDYQLSLKLLSERGYEISQAEIQTLKEKRLNTLKAPATFSLTWIIIGYISALLGGFLGVIIGYHLRYSKKTLPDGTRSFNYTAEMRQQGKIIIILSCISIPLWFYFKINS